MSKNIGGNVMRKMKKTVRNRGDFIKKQRKLKSF